MTESEKNQTIKDEVLVEPTNEIFGKLYKNILALLKTQFTVWNSLLTTNGIILSTYVLTIILANIIYTNKLPQWYIFIVFIGILSVLYSIITILFYISDTRNLIIEIFTINIQIDKSKITNSVDSINKFNDYLKNQAGKEKSKHNFILFEFFVLGVLLSYIIDKDFKFINFIWNNAKILIEYIFTKILLLFS